MPTLLEIWLVITAINIEGFECDYLQLGAGQKFYRGTTYRFARFPAETLRPPSDNISAPRELSGSRLKERF